jgi:hypothetical protein
MSLRQIALPPNSVLGENLLNSFTRAGEHGNLIISNLLGSDHWVGFSPTYTWRKYDDGSILGPHTIKIVNGELQVLGRSNSGGTYRYGWLASHDMILLIPGTVIDIHLRLPSLAGTSSIHFRFAITMTHSDATFPTNTWDYLACQVYANTSQYAYEVYKRVAGSVSTLTEYNEVPASVPMTAAEGTFRIRVYRGGEIQVFFHEGTGDVVETEDSVVDKQDMGLGWDRGFAAFELATGDTTNRTMDCDQLTIQYPSLQGLFRAPIADKYHSDVELWDGDPSSGGVRVYGHDHKFSGDIFVQNGVTRFRVNIGDGTGFRHLYWTGSAYAEPLNASLYYALQQTPKDIHYPQYREIVQNSRDVVTVKVRMTDTTVDDEDYWVDSLFTLRRGQRGVIVNPIALHPLEEWIVVSTDFASKFRWGYVAGVLGNPGIPILGDDDLNIVASTGTDMRDNWNAQFDDDQDQAISTLATNIKPLYNGESQAWEGGIMDWRKYGAEQIRDAKFLIAWTPFPKIANLFREAEYCLDQGWHVGGVKNTGDSDDSGDNVELGSQFDEVFYLFTAGTDLPEGRYLLIVRVKDSNQISNDLWLYVTNNTDAENRNEENGTAYATCQASYNTFGIFFEITAQDVSDTDLFKLSAGKSTSSTNTIKVDYLCLVPYSNGRDWSQDLAHIFLRHHNQSYHVDPRIN